LSEFLDRGADPFAASPTELSPARRSLNLLDETLGDRLLTNRPSLAVRPIPGDAPLHLAAQTGRTNAIDFLLRAGVSANQKNGDGRTPSLNPFHHSVVSFGARSSLAC